MVQGDPNPSQVMQGAQLSELVQGLRASGLLRGYSHMLTGYIGSASFLRAVLDTVRVGGLGVGVARHRQGGMLRGRTPSGWDA